MIGSLIRRRVEDWQRRSPDFAFDTTNFSLSTEVPRPDDRRTEERLLAILPVAKMVAGEAQDLCKIRNISAGGLMAEVTRVHPVGTEVTIEFNSHQSVPGQVVWIRKSTCGVKFAEDVDLRELLANRPTVRNGIRARPPRLEVKCKATVRIGENRYHVEVQDISLGGLKVAVSDWNCVGKNVVVMMEDFRPVKGTVAWYKNNHAGIVFHRSLSFEELAEWMGKRVEVAALKAGAWARSSRY